MRATPRKVGLWAGGVVVVGIIGIIWIVQASKSGGERETLEREEIAPTAMGQPLPSENGARHGEGAPEPRVGSSTSVSPGVRSGFRVSVVDIVGAPLADVEVQVRPVAGEESFGVSPPPRTEIARTTRNGTCDFERLPESMMSLIVAQGDGQCALYGPVLRTELSEGRQIELRMSPAVHVRGVVRSTAGPPIAGAKIRIHIDRRRFNIPCETNTTAAGDFGFMPLPAGLFSGTVSLDASAPGLLHRTEAYSVEEVSEEPVVLVLGEWREFRGRCVGVDRLPLSKVKVGACGEAETTETDENGIFVLRVPSTLAESLVFVAGGRTVSRMDNLGRAGDIVVDVGEVQLKRGLPVSGTVTNTSGDAIRGAKVLLTYAALPPLRGIESVAGVVHVVGETHTNDGGEFRLEEIGDVPHTVEVWEEVVGKEDEGESQLRREGVVGGSTDLRLVVGGQTIRVRCVDMANGEVMAVRGSVLVKVFVAGEREEWEGPLWEGIGVEGGRVQVAKPGRYDVEVDADGFLPGMIEGVTVVVGEEVGITVPLVRKGPDEK